MLVLIKTFELENCFPLIDAKTNDIGAGLKRFLFLLEAGFGAFDWHIRDAKIMLRCVEVPMSDKVEPPKVIEATNLYYQFLSTSRKADIFLLLCSA